MEQAKKQIVADLEEKIEKLLLDTGIVGTAAICLTLDGDDGSTETVILGRFKSKALAFNWPEVERLISGEINDLASRISPGGLA
jgi:hypothetical protein